MLYNIDFERPGMIVIPVVQSDNGRDADFELYKDGEAYDPMADWGVQTSDGMIRIDYRKPDGTKGSYDTLPSGGSAYTLNGNQLKVRWAPQMFTAAGKVLVNIVLTNENYTLHSFEVILNVQPAAVPDDVPSEDYYALMTLAQMTTYLDAMRYLRIYQGSFPADSGSYTISGTGYLNTIIPNVDIRAGDYISDDSDKIMLVTQVDSNSITGNIIFTSNVAPKRYVNQLIAPAYTVSHPWQKGSLCIKDGLLYQANDNIAGEVPWDPRSWTQTDVATAILTITSQLVDGNEVSY